MPDQLSAADRATLAAEQRGVNMTIGALLLIERGPGVTYQAICDRIAERVHLLPRYRQRLHDSTIGIAGPVWVDDRDFHVEWHVRLALLPAPGGDAELAAYVGREFSRRLERGRPMWELHLVEGLSGDRLAVVVKMHHAMVDGLAALGIGMILMDLSAEPGPVEAPPGPWTPKPYALSRHLGSLAGSRISKGHRLLLDATGRMLDVSPRSAEADLRRATDFLVRLSRARSPAPVLPFNRPISGNRSYAFASASLAEVKAAGKATGGTINDVILAAVTGMLARYLREAGVAVQDLPRDPVALVPVSIRQDGNTAGNRISIVFVDLPVRELNPAKRVALLAERMAKIKRSAAVAAGAFAIDATGFVPPLLLSALGALPLPGGSGGSPNNLVVSNVPGPQVPLYLNGSRVLAIHPVVPLNPSDQGLNIGVFSYDGTVFFGVNADRNLDPPIARAAMALEEAVAELVALT